VLFSGVDTANRVGLWTTDGTTAGTFEIPVSGAYVTGAHPREFAVLKGTALFAGDDNQPVGSASGHFGMLFAYNGQVATEITGIANAFSGGLNVSDLTVFNNEVLFNAFDAAGTRGLWVTDGTAAGTHEIPVNNAAPAGLNPSDLTVIAPHEVLFNGVNAAGIRGLWETDGTTAGTHELLIAGANLSGLTPSDITLIGGQQGKADVQGKNVALFGQYLAASFPTPNHAASVVVGEVSDTPHLLSVPRA